MFKHLAIALALASSAAAAPWYLDSAAAGANNGTSWANAWQSATSVVWGASGVKAGDTLYISGGTSTKSYADLLTIGASGVPGSNIVIRLGQELNHNGRAIFPAINFDVRTNVTVDGSKNPFFIPPKSTFLMDGITNNIGIQTGPRYTGLGVAFTGAGGANNTLRYVEVGYHGSITNSGDIHGIRFLNMTSWTNMLIEACYVHDIQNDGININLAPTIEYWNGLVVSNCVIERTGDDGIQNTQNGFRVYNTWLRSHFLGLYNGHPDQLQLSGTSRRYIGIYNCIFNDKGNSLIIGELLAEEGGLLGPLHVVGNVFYNTRDWIYATNGTQAYGWTLDVWRANSPDTNVNVVTWTNLVIAHNLTYYQRTTPMQLGRADPTASTRSAWQVYFGGVNYYANNLWIDVKYNAPGTAAAINIQGNGDGPGTNGIYYTTAQLIPSNNITWGPTPSLSYHGSSQLIASDHGMGILTNSTLTETNSYTFALDTADTVANNYGIDLSSITSSVPALARDLAGNARAAGDFDVGARQAIADYSSLTNQLLCHLPLNESLINNLARDVSGNGLHGYHFGFDSGATGTNRWPTNTYFTNKLTGLLQGAVRFRQYTNDGWGLYNHSCDYIGITNTAILQGLTNFTMALWVKRDPSPSGNWEDDMGRYVSAGFGYIGAWTVGMFTDRGVQRSYVRLYNANNATNDTYTSFGAATEVDTSPPDEGYLDWVHLTWTFSNSVVSTYADGAFVSATSTTQTGTTWTNHNYLTVRGVSGSTNTAFVALGIDTHNGNPFLTPFDDSGEQYPNHAFFGGYLSDFRMYSRVLSTNEILAVARNEPYQGGSGGESGGGGSTNNPSYPNVTAQRATFNNLTVNGTISGP